MSKTFNYFFSIILLTHLLSCKQENITNPRSEPENSQKAVNIIHNSSTIELLEQDVTWEYIINADNASKTISIPKDQLPFKNMAILSASSVGYLDALNELESVAGVFDPQWIYNPKLHERLKLNPQMDQGNSASLNLEKILSLNPDVIIGFSDPNMAKTYQRIEEAGILVVYIDEYKEGTPLGKAEFIKLFGVLTDKQQKADSLYNVIESNYVKYRDLALAAKSKPTVFAEIMRGDVWYMPGGESFAAQFFKDAGANYLWSDDDKSGSLKLNFEQVYEKAENADYWMNAANFSSLSELKKAYINHDWFHAYNDKEVYSFAKRTNASGANDYFELGAVRVDWVLKDLIHIFHSELLPNHELVFYQKLD